MDASEFSEWVELYSDDLFNWALSRTGKLELAEDLVQETFMSAFKARDKFNQKSKPKTWLISILNNKIYDHFRRKLKLNEVSQDEFFDESGSWVEEMNPNEWSDDIERGLRKCISKLPEVWAIAIRMKYLNGEDSEEICQELEITPSNYWQIVHRAKMQLRICLEKNVL
ncbi:MAG: RNA polymerase subunit sigma [Bacteroidetes bacterium]|nr:MAG: RNA polymerase subunit sigma [Bacteroidota bacterium]